MKKRIIFVLIAIMAVSFSSTGSTAPKFLKKAKEKITGKKEEKKAPVAVAANVVLAKGIQVSGCYANVTDDGTITIAALKNGVTIAVKNGLFDLVLPSNPVFGDETELYKAAKGNPELSFGSVKVYRLNVADFTNASSSSDQKRGNLSLDIYYSESDVKGTIDGDPVTLKKGWNIIDSETSLYFKLACYN